MLCASPSMPSLAPVLRTFAEDGYSLLRDHLSSLKSFSPCRGVALGRFIGFLYSCRIMLRYDYKEDLGYFIAICSGAHGARRDRLIAFLFASRETGCVMEKLVFERVESAVASGAPISLPTKRVAPSANRRLSVLMGRLEWMLYGDDLQNQRAQLSIALLSRGRR